MVNLGDIAKATGYSKATVSRILSGDPSFTAKESTRHRVIQVANELGLRAAHIPRRRSSDHRGA